MVFLRKELSQKFYTVACLQSTATRTLWNFSYRVLLNSQSLAHKIFSQSLKTFANFIGNNGPPKSVHMNAKCVFVSKAAKTASKSLHRWRRYTSNSWTSQRHISVLHIYLEPDKNTLVLSPVSQCASTDPPNSACG